MAATATEPVVTPPDRRARPAAVDVALVLDVVALLAFPALARLAAAGLPVVPRAAALPPLPAHARGGAARDVPVGRRGPATLPAVRVAATTLLGPRRAARLLAVVRAQTSFPRLAAGYPYRYPGIDAILPARLDPAGATDLSARLMILAAQHRDTLYAAPVAYALLDRARAAGGCAPQLDLVALLAGDDQSGDDVVAPESARTLRACPGDPTAGWLVGQLQSQRLLLGKRIGPYEHPAPTFRTLQRRFPGSPAGWSGEADADLRLAYQLQQPFHARSLYARALLLYRRAQRLHPDPGFLAGEARALAGLGRAAEAVAVQRRAITAFPPNAVLLAPLVRYLEQAHRFAAAAATAARLPTLPRRPADPNALLPAHVAASNDAALQNADAAGALSLGLGRLQPLNASLHGSEVQANGAVLDLSFIPAFREVEGVTGSQPWCAEWSRRRDLVLAGRPAAALAGYPSDFEDLRGADGQVCDPNGPDDGTLLAAVARLAAGRRPGANPDGWTLADAEDAWQELWRWAGDYPQAERAARDWVRRRPRVSQARLELGEVEFLRRRYDAAASDFGAAARLAQDASNAEAEARGWLDRGAALAAGGRRAEALPVLLEADEVASHAGGSATASYYARVQAGDLYRERGMLKAAADAYDAAREQEPPGGDADLKVGALEDDAAIVAIGLGRDGAALAAANRAVATDPENPAFRMTQGFAALRAGRIGAAIADDRAALAADPTTFPAANDLGVLLARRGENAAAVAALRRAVGANRDYALGWFNLGVVLARMGPLHLASSQGALGRAIALDPALRDRKREPTIDARTYHTGLDLSKPLPLRWSFAVSQRHAPARTAGLVALLLVFLGLARALRAAGGPGRELAGRWLEPLGGLRRLPQAWPALVAVLATLVVFGLPLARGDDGLTAATAGLLATLVLAGAVVRGRVAAARRARVAAAESAWPPGVVFGVAASAAGVPWAPLPVVKTPEKAGALVHWAGPLAAGALGLLLTGLGAVTDVPLTRAAAVAALVMAASLLTPIKPLDGASLAAEGAKATALTAAGLAALGFLGLM